MKRDTLLLYSSFLNAILGMSLLAVAVGQITSPSLNGIHSVDPWSWGVLIAGIVLLAGASILGILSKMS